MNLWYDEKKSFHSLTVLRYRDLRKDPHKHFKTVLEFLGLRMTDEEVYTKAVEFSGFENMRKLEQKDFFADPRMRAKDAGEVSSFKTRKGKVGGYKESVSKEDQEYMNTAMKKLNPTFGFCDV